MLISLELAFNFTQHFWDKCDNQAWRKTYLCTALQTKFNFHNNKTYFILLDNIHISVITFLRPGEIGSLGTFNDYNF